MSWETFRPAVDLERPRATWMPSGALYVNAAAQRLLPKGALRGVELLHGTDDEQRVLALRPVDPGHENAYRAPTGLVSVRAFLTFHGLHWPSEPVRVEVVVQDGLLLVPIPEKCAA